MKIFSFILLSIVIVQSLIIYSNYTREHTWMDNYYRISKDYQALQMKFAKSEEDNKFMRWEIFSYEKSRS